MKSKSNQSIVLVGGGSGVYRIASSLKHYTTHISTVQTMFDYGGNSKQLRDERGMLPPGDIRRAILALADDAIEPDLRLLLSHRFEKKGSSIDDATIGNLMLTAFTEHYNGDIVKAINALCRIFRVSGSVLPVSVDHAHLCVRLSDGSILRGEGDIDTRSIDDERTITEAFLEPEAHMYTGADEALRAADKIIFCPGDLFTSIIPNTLVQGFKETISKSDAKLILVMNLMTKKAETDGFTASMFAKTVLKYIGRKKFDIIICNDAVIKPHLQKKYAHEKSSPVVIDRALSRYTKKIIRGDFAQQGDVLRHSAQVAKEIIQA